MRSEGGTAASARWEAIGVAVALAMAGCKGEGRREGPPPPPPPAITASADAGGTIVPSGRIEVATGEGVAFTIAPEAGGFTIADVIVDGASQGAIASYVFTNVSGDHTIVARFHPPVPVTVTAGAGGTISPNGTVTLPRGEKQTFTIRPDEGFIVGDVTVDGVSQGAVTEVTVSDVTSPRTVSVTFTRLPTCAELRLEVRGSLPPGKRIGGVQATLVYASGAGLSIAANDVTASGMGAHALLAANTKTAGRVTLGAIDADGFDPGEFATASFDVVPGKLPVDADFQIAPGALVIDQTGAPIPGITVAAGGLNLH